MTNYSTNEFKSGLKVILDGDPCSIIENEFVKPGKGFVRGAGSLRQFRMGTRHGEAGERSPRDRYPIAG